MVAVCTLGCTRKLHSIYSWETLFQLEGDYTLYINFEATDDGLDRETNSRDEVRNIVRDLSTKNPNVQVSLDVWSWQTEFGTNWRARPKFDQDQARLAPIVAARNMCIEYAMQTKASHLLFVDSDIIPPIDVISKLLAVDHDAVCGMVNGRGVHSQISYIFGEKRRFQHNGIDIIEVEHANIGYTMISRKLFHEIRFRHGETMYRDGRGMHHVSDDPAYHYDAYLKFGEWPWIRQDCVGKHCGQLDDVQTSSHSELKTYP